MKKLALLSIAALFMACQKEEEAPASQPFDQVYTMWTRPMDQSAIAMTIDGIGVEVHHDTLYPYKELLHASIRHDSLYWVETPVKRDAIVTVESTGSHAVYLTAEQQCVTPGSLTFEVY